MKITPIRDSRVAEILLVDDSEDAVFLTREAFDVAKLRVNLKNVDNGLKCLQFLRKEGPYGDAPTPDLILLDINMPVMNGYEVLTEIVKDDKLKHLPVVILTTSYEAADIHKMYALRCSSYITKPVDFDDFVKAISQLASYWLTTVVVPDSTHPYRS